MSIASEPFHSILCIGPESREVYCIERHSGHRTSPGKSDHHSGHHPGVRHSPSDRVSLRERWLSWEFLPSFTSRNWIQLDFFHRKFPLEAGFVFRQRRQKNIGTLPLGLRSLVLLSLVITMIFKPGFTFGCFPLNPFENALVESFSLNRAFPGFSFRLFHYTFLALPNTL